MVVIVWKPLGPIGSPNPYPVLVAVDSERAVTARIAFGVSGIHDEGDPWEPAPTAAVLPAATQADRIKGKLGVPATAREVVDATPAVREVVETPVQARRPSESDEPPDDVALPPFEEGGR